MILPALSAAVAVTSATLAIAAVRKMRESRLPKEADYFRYCRNYAALSAVACVAIAVRASLWEVSTGVAVALLGLVASACFLLWIGFRCFQAAASVSDVHRSLDNDRTYSISIGRRPGLFHLIASPTEIVVNQGGVVSAFECSVGGARLFFQGDVDEITGRLDGRHKVQGTIKFPSGRTFIGPANELGDLVPEIS